MSKADNQSKTITGRLRALLIPAPLVIALISATCYASDYRIGSWPMPNALGANPPAGDYRDYPKAFEAQDQERLAAMANLLTNYTPGNWEKYKKLCAEARSVPVIGMTKIQARATTWCYPLSMNKTTTASGIREQEVYTHANGNSNAPKRYLYFENGILTTIQE